MGQTAALVVPLLKGEMIPVAITLKLGISVTKAAVEGRLVQRWCQLLEQQGSFVLGLQGELRGRPD